MAQLSPDQVALSFHTGYFFSQMSAILVFFSVQTRTQINYQLKGVGFAHGRLQAWCLNLGTELIQ